MFETSDIDRDSARPDGLPSRGWSIALGASMLPVYLVFAYLNMKGKGIFVAISVSTLLVIGKMRWQNKDRPAFWIILGSYLLTVLALIAVIPIPNRDYNFLLVAPWGFLLAIAADKSIQNIVNRADG